MRNEVSADCSLEAARRPVIVPHAALSSPLIREAASKHSVVVVVQSDDPRGEPAKFPLCQLLDQVTWAWVSTQDAKRISLEVWPRTPVRPSEFEILTDDELAFLHAEIEAREADSFASMPKTQSSGSDQQLQCVDVMPSQGCLVAVAPVAPVTSSSEPSSHTSTGNSAPLTTTWEKGGEDDRDCASGSRKQKQKSVTVTSGKRASCVVPREQARGSCVPANTNFFVSRRRWRDLSTAEHYIVAANYIQDSLGLAVSLNLSPERERSLRAGGKTSIKRRFQNLLNDELGQAGLSGLPYALTFEVSPEGRLHLHGMVDSAGRDLEAIKTALRRAAGKISGPAGARQLKVKELYDGVGWARYMDKARKQTARELDTKELSLMSRSLVQAAEAYHNECRLGSGSLKAA